MSLIEAVCSGARWLLSRDRNLGVLERELAGIPQLGEVPMPRPTSVGLDTIECWGILDSRSGEEFLRGGEAPRCLWFGCRNTRVATRPERFRPITRRTSATDFCCDIREVEGLACSKSRLENFGTLDEFAVQNCAELVGSATIERLGKNLEHAGGKIGTDGFFGVKAWDGRIFWFNSDASHHFAAARFIAGRLGTPVPLRKPLHVELLDEDEVSALTGTHDMFAVGGAAELSLWSTLNTHEVPHGLLRYPRPLEDWWIVLLPKDERRSAFVAERLRQLGLMDVGAHLGDLCARQRIPRGCR